MSKNSLILSANTEIIETSGVGNLLRKIRPQWQAKKLIQRVTMLLPIDPSSACQRILNASIHDLREKIIIAGLDIAKEAAKQHKLPAIEKADDVENYSTSRIIALSYRMGLLSRPEWRRLLRAYDIRKDLEHEDDEYEAGVEDCVYIFKSCVDIVLSKDPIHLIKITDIKDVIEEPTPTTLNESILEDFNYAPQPRQSEIYKLLLSNALDKEQPDIVRQNSYNALFALSELSYKQVLLDSANDLVNKLGRKTPSLLEARVAFASGILPYLKKVQIKQFFREYFSLMEKTGFQWRRSSSHGELLRNLEEVGGLDHCPDQQLENYVRWLMLCYIGEPGGYGMGLNRKVFYSNIGAPISLKILYQSNKNICSIVESIEREKLMKKACADEYVARRFQSILDKLDEDI